ncbi:MAG: M48 family metalloprotease [Gammaproteobacteria bacterium]
MLRHLYRLLCGGTLLIAATTAVAEHAWRVDQLARAPGADVGLALPGGAVLARLSTARVRQLYAAYGALAAAAETRAQFVIVLGKWPNAFAGLAGDNTPTVGINLAMLELLQDDLHAAAGVLGHELAHLKLHHAEDAARRGVTGSALGTIGELVMGGLGIPGGALLSDLSVQAVDAAYSRDDEREADYLGTIWAVEAGFDPQGAVRLHEALRRRTGGGGGDFLASHPSSPERIATLKALAARLSR